MSVVTMKVASVLRKKRISIAEANESYFWNTFRKGKIERGMDYQADAPPAGWEFVRPGEPADYLSKLGWKLRENNWEILFPVDLAVVHIDGVPQLPTDGGVPDTNGFPTDPDEKSNLAAELLQSFIDLGEEPAQIFADLNNSRYLRMGTTIVPKRAGTKASVASERLSAMERFTNAMCDGLVTPQDLAGYKAATDKALYARTWVSRQK